MSDLTIHVLANAHLDPVWLWDWREGLNEGISTCRAMLDIMDERPDFTFFRGEAAVYRHIEEEDPETFARLRARYAEGRWDIVGGNLIQPDTNLPATVGFLQQFAIGRAYFRDRFDLDVRVAWAADSFGHTAGLPEILAAAGFKYFAFSRPQQEIVPLPKPVFHWRGQGGADILCCRIPLGCYCNERDNTTANLDQLLAKADGLGVRNLPLFFGLGDHGGGAARRQLDDIDAWAAAHPDVNVLYSTLTGYFAAVEAEAALAGPDYFPEFIGEMNFCLRGCYASAAHLKRRFRHTEASRRRAEAVIAAATAVTGESLPDLNGPADALAFNAFHDILPGSSIERAVEEQIQWLGGAQHACRAAEFAAVNALARAVDTSVPAPPPDHPAAVPVLIVNPHPWRYRGPVEVEVALDARPIGPYHGRPHDIPLLFTGPDGARQPFQVIATEHRAWPELVWRRRIVAPVEIPPMGWAVHTLTWLPDAPVPAVPPAPARALGARSITNDVYAVGADHGAATVDIRRQGRSLLGDGLAVALFEDPWGSWGGMGEEPESLTNATVRETWTITDVRLLETGPQRATLWVRFAGSRSHVDLHFRLVAGRDAVDVEARLFMADRAARVRLLLPAGDTATYEVPGGTVDRAPCGEVPGGRWVEIHGPAGDVGFASDAIYSFAGLDGAVAATICRTPGYATTITTGPDGYPESPAMDVGEHRFRFVLTGGDVRRLAAELERPPVVQTVPAAVGELPRLGSTLELGPEAVVLHAVEPTGDGFMLTVQNCADAPAAVNCRWLGQAVAGPELPPWRIVVLQLTPGAAGWTLAEIP